MPRRVALLMGGRSSEHPVSLASARSVFEALDPARYDVVTVEIGRDGRWSLGSGSPGQIGSGSNSPGLIGPGPVSDTGGGSVANRPQPPVPATDGAVATTLADVDVVLPILHGPFGEDGTVQGLLELAGVPYVGAGVLGSAVAMDKDVFKVLMRGAGIPVTPSVTIRRGRPIEHPFEYPVFVKPARLGSSVGITKVNEPDELEPAIDLARRHDEKVLIEEFVSGVEVECGVLGNDRPIASIPGEIVAHGFAGTDWYDYSAKYDEGGMDLIIPPRVTEEQSRRVQELSVDAFIAAECEGMARVDCFVRDNGEVLVNELNTIPGFTETSVYAKLFEASGIPYAELLERLIELACERHERRSTLEF
jgi:D-alanine-D-alanine ligase